MCVCWLPGGGSSEGVSSAKAGSTKVKGSMGLTLDDDDDDDDEVCLIYF